MTIRYYSMASSCSFFDAVDAVAEFMSVKNKMCWEIGNSTGQDIVLERFDASISENSPDSIRYFKLYNDTTRRDFALRIYNYKNIRDEDIVDFNLIFDNREFETLKIYDADTVELLRVFDFRHRVPSFHPIFQEEGWEVKYHDNITMFVTWRYDITQEDLGL